MSEILTYCREMGITSTDLKDCLIELVQAMDDVFIGHAAEERSAKSAKSDVVTE